MRLRIARVRACSPFAFSGLVDNRLWRPFPALARIERIAQSKRTRRMKVEFLTHSAGEILSLPKPPILLTLEEAETLTNSDSGLSL